jgi:hypothetical protein
MVSPRIVMPLAGASGVPVTLKIVFKFVATKTRSCGGLPLALWK